MADIKELLEKAQLDISLIDALIEAPHEVGGGYPMFPEIAIVMANFCGRAIRDLEIVKEDLDLMIEKTLKEKAEHAF